METLDVRELLAVPVQQSKVRMDTTVGRDGVAAKGYQPGRK